MSVHIVGMGVLGSQLALELDRQGLPFTWEDAEAEYTAWHCSTGIVYPSGHDRDMAGLRRWVQEVENGGPLAEFAEKVPYLYAHKNPPHGGTYEAFPVPGSKLSVATEPSVAVNVPLMVQTVRERYTDRRRESAPTRAEVTVHAYADPEKLEGYLWGWAARVRFDGPHVGGAFRSATYYAKKHRFNLTYAYPIPGTGQWWAGSTLLHQGTPSTREVQPYVDQWVKDAQELLGLRNIVVDSVDQGWRPRREPGTLNEAREVETNVWHLAPEPTSGVRHGPLIVADLMVRAGLW